MEQNPQLQTTVLQGNRETLKYMSTKQYTFYNFKFDDYNWDWSLQQISHHCLKEKFQVVMVKGPRVFHIGEW